jgi:N-acetylmuramoyl-L-alanine amidase
MTAHDETTANRGKRAHARRRSRSRRVIGPFALVAVVSIVLLARTALESAPAREIIRHPAVRAGGAAASKSAARQVSRAIDPSLFTRGSCVEYSPSSGDAHKTVFIDAGHGGIDPGALGTTESGQVIHEAIETLPVELDTMALLRAKGYTVVVSRTRQSVTRRLGPGDVSGAIFTVPGEVREIASRDICANDAHANILLGIYFDAGGDASNAGSVTAYDTARPFWRKSERLASLLERDVLAAMNAHGWQIPNDGVESDASLGGPPLGETAASYGHLLLLGPAMKGYFSNPSTMPGALVEPLFITDPFEGSIAVSTTGQKAIARGLARAVEQYFAR